MDKYLLLLLKEVNTIIIPDLGALTITNQKTGEIMFMPYLKYDDGKLATYISEKEGFELNDAKNLIAKYVRDVQAVLDRGESYDMFEFGSFLKDKSGDVIFNNWDGSLPSDSKLKEKEEIVNIEEESIIPQIDEVMKMEVVEEPTISINEEISEPTEVIDVVEEIISEEQVIEDSIPTDNAKETSGYQNDIEGVFINSEKELEIKIGENHILALRNSGKVEMLKAGIALENFADSLPKPEIIHTPKVSKEDIRAERLKAKGELPKAEPEVPIVKEEIKIEEPVVEKISTPIVPKAELTPEEAEAKRIKNAEREADRERRLAERMEKLAMKGMPAEEVESKSEEAPTKTEEKPKQEEPSKEEPSKKEEAKKNKKEKVEKPGKRSFIVQKTANQKSSIILAASIILVGILGGIGIILFNSGDISAPKLAESKELAENNKNLESKVNTTTEVEETTTEVVETSEEVVEEPFENDVPVETPKVEVPKKEVIKQAVATTPIATSNSTGKYHIIGGSFSIEVNANNFVNQMIAKGLDAKLLGRIDKMYVVSLGSYNSKSEAISESKSIDIKGWIFKQK